MAPKIIIALLVAVLTACGGPDTELIEESLDQAWDSLTPAQQADLCDSYILFGPTDLERMLVNAFHEEDITEAEIAQMVDKAGEECL